MVRFHLRNKLFFLTYPQCPTPKDVAVTSFQKLLGNDLEWIVVAQESHLDGHLHLHIGLKTKTRLTVSDPSFFDLGTHHGNYQVMRNVHKCFQYLSKEDPEPLSVGIDVKTQLEVFRNREIDFAVYMEGVIAAAIRDERLRVEHRMFFQLHCDCSEGLMCLHCELWTVMSPMCA